MKRLYVPGAYLAFFVILWIKAIYPPSSGIPDTDFFWHLTYGEDMVRSLSIPATDYFSWTFDGKPYQLTQWLGEAIMGQFYISWGFSGTKWLSVFLAGVSIWFSWQSACRYVHTEAALLIAFMSNLIHLITPMRPQLFSFACVSIAVYLIISWIETRKKIYLWLYPLLMALWVNLHGGYVVGFIILGLMIIGSTIEGIKGQYLKLYIKILLFEVWILLLSVLASLINPYGYKAWTIVLMIGGLMSSTVISEWQPVNLFTGVGWFYLLNIIPYLAFMLISNARPRITHGLLAGFFLVFGIMANRQVAICASAMAPFIAALLARTPQFQKIGFSLANSNRNRPLLHILTMSVMIMLYFPIANYGNRKMLDSIEHKYPVHATEFLIKNKLTDRVISDTLEASYLIHKRIPVFIDGRMDLYKDHFFFQWLLASKSAPGWEKLIEEYPPSALLLREEMAIRQTLLASGKWKQVFQDKKYSVLVPIETNLPEVNVSDSVFLDSTGKLVRPFMP